MIFKREHFDLLGKVVLGRIIFKPPFKANAALKDEARFVNIVNGKSHLYVPNAQLDLKTGDSLMMKCESFVNNWFENDNDEPSEAIIIHFYPDVLKYVYDDKIPKLFQTSNSLKTAPIEKINNNGMIHHFIEGLRFYFDHPGLVTEDLIKIKVKELVLVLLNSDLSNKIKPILNTLFQTNEYEFKEIIHSHIFDDLKTQDLAFFAGLSLSSFKRKFKTVFGTTPTNYIKTKRLERAQVMLKTTNERISNIAYDCGFKDVGYFSKSFAAHYNQSPSEYRKSLLT